jgi:uncharacterized protein YkwD
MRAVAPLATSAQWEAGGAPARRRRWPARPLAPLAVVALAAGLALAPAGAAAQAGPWGGTGGLGLTPGTPAPDAAPAAMASVTAAREVARMAEAVNALRLQNGQLPLKLQAQLTLAAQQHAEEMAQSRTLSHVGAFGSRPADRMRAAGYQACGGGENVAFGLLQTVDDIARGWYDSPAHREILLSAQAREMGIGRSQTPDGLVYWALEVGLRPAVAPIVINAEAAATPTSDVTVYVYPEVGDSCWGPTRPIVQVTLSNDADFATAQTFPYSPTLPWTLAPGEGVRTVYARLQDSSGRIVEAQDDILVSSAAPPPSTASELSPPVQTLTLVGPDGTPVQLTLYRVSYVVPPGAALPAPPCVGCWGGPGALPGSAPLLPPPGPPGGSCPFPGAC